MDFSEFRKRAESNVDEHVEDLAEAVIGAAIEVHRHLGPGLPESCYKKALSHELTLRGIQHQCEAPVPIFYKGVRVGDGKVDLLVDKLLVVELKVAECLTDTHRAQAKGYLAALKLELAL
jgi:GxxExxY protein